MATKWIDQARACCVTAQGSGVRFVAPILIGDPVSVHARLIHTGRSSMHSVVDVFARDLRRAR